MTRTFLTNRFWLSLKRASLLSGSLICLFVIAGCSGSQLGDTLGQRLEPDPQLADNEKTPTGGTADADGQAGDGKTKPTTTPDSSDDAKTPATSTADSSDSSADDDKKAKPAEDEATAQSEDPKVVGGDYTDLAKAPEELQPYLVDLLELGLLEVRPPAAAPTPAPSTASSDGDSSDGAAAPAKPKPAPAPPKADEFRPNQAVTRREYARWLLAANNRFYSGQRTRKISPGVSSAKPVFQDVKVNDPDFDAIQGLAEAGIIPSPLTGSSTTVTFRPDAPLTRKDLLLWKVPLDTRQLLPQATAAAVQQAWGFQDAGKIEPRALQAVLADHQNGDFSNIRRAFNYTTLFQPDKAATRSEAAAVIWRFGNSTEGITAAELRSPQIDASDDDA
ncbi:MAG: S-layer homology domain-containing protein [Cyanobacteria bacterium P01_F01_bin.53]